MRLAFYLEPALFRNNPGLLSPHLGWFTFVVQALGISSADTIVLITTKSLCSVFERKLIERFELKFEIEHYQLDPVDVLLAFDGSLPHYARDLYDLPDAPVQNGYLDLQIANAFKVAAPNLIICSSENRYVVRHRPEHAQLFFIEKAPLPSWAGTNLYFDPIGHQSLGTLSRHWSALLAARYAGAEQDAGRALLMEVERRRVADRESDIARRIVGKLQPGREVIMVALQPHEWLSWEGALKTAYRPLDLLLQVAAKFPEYQMLPTFHADMQVADDAIKLLRQIQPNIVDLSPSECTGVSEILLTVVSHVYSVSSAVGMSALLYGCNLICDANSYLTSAAVSTDEFRAGRTAILPYEQRVSLAAFLTSRLSRDVIAMNSLEAYRLHADGIGRAIGLAAEPHVPW